ncbi:MAG TPA: EF-hand domain-containing protein [Sphingomicrobium sp.]|nr:EF-hand domain-containing protein [Sphingomicrobium sp.]
MPLFAVILPFLASVAQLEGQTVVVRGYPWAPFVSPMGQPFRSRSPEDDPFARWFHQADRDRDGILTADEMRADAARFFDTLDNNHDREIDSEEIVVYEQDIAPEVQVNSEWKRNRQEAATEKQLGENRDGRGRRWAGDSVNGYQIDGLQGAARYGLLNLPQPVIGADADLNRKVTLDEFSRAATYRFQLLDTKRVGGLTLQELEMLVPSRPKAGKRAKRRKDAVDTRIGVPLPEAD